MNQYHYFIYRPRSRSACECKGRSVVLLSSSLRPSEEPSRICVFDNINILPELPLYQVFCLLCLCCYRGNCYLCEGAFKFEDGFTLFKSETAIMDFYIFHFVHYDTIVTMSTNKIHTLRCNHNSDLIYAKSYIFRFLLAHRQGVHSCIQQSSNPSIIHSM